jgi:lysyl-tRNA synthetase class I
VSYSVQASIAHVTYMVRCPDCKKENARPFKKWKYGQFDAAAFRCTCGTEFREYTRDGKHSFALKRKKGERFVKG